MPTDVTSLFVRLWGAGGGGQPTSVGGGSAFVSGNLSVTPGDTLTILVGGGGGGGGLGGSGGSGYFGGGGTNNVNGDGGGSSLTTNPLFSFFIGGADGSGVMPGGTSEPFYIMGVGVGGGIASNGGNGEIVVSYVTPAAVPEPGSVALLVGLGVAGAGFVRKRRHRS